MMTLPPIVLAIVSALSMMSCRGPSAAAVKVASQDAAVGRPPAANRLDWKERAVSSAVEGVERHLSVKETLAVMDGRVLEVSEVSKEGWCKAALKSGNTAVLSGDGDGREIREVSIYFQPSDGLRLRHLEPILGPYRKVFESKTAGVRFDRVPAQGVIAFADLFSSKILLDSEVVTVSIRRSSTGDDHGR